MTISYSNFDNADEQKQTVGQMAASAALGFLGNLINAKQQGQELPPVLDKVATIAISGQDKAIEIAQKEAKEHAINQMAWIIAGVLAVVLIIVLLKK